MNPTNQTDRYPSEEIRYPSRCSFPDCRDDIIPDPNGVDLYCFKHQVDSDI